MILGNNTLDNKIGLFLDFHLKKLKQYFQNKGILTDIMSYTGDIHDAYLTKFRELIEIMVSIRDENVKTLTIILTTPGGSPVAVEKMVDIIRHYYDEINFIVPNSAMSAGTIFCMAGDKIYMDYSSSLGPIDPQVLKGDKYVPALGYLDKVNEFIEKSKAGTLSPAEFSMMQELDLAELAQYEQAKDLSIDLLKEWLVKYKFKNWDTHRSDPTKKDNEVTHDEKIERAKDIAEKLSDNSLWHSHGRYIGIKTLQNILKLEIDDYSDNQTLRTPLLEYSNLLTEFVAKNNRRVYFHTNLKKE